MLEINLNECCLKCDNPNIKLNKKSKGRGEKSVAVYCHNRTKCNKSSNSIPIMYLLDKE